MGSDPLADDLAAMRPAAGGGDPLADDLARMRPAAPEQSDKGALDAFGRSALQGASFSFFDEAASALKALAEGRDTGRGGPSFGERYRRNVDEERGGRARASCRARAPARRRTSAEWSATPGRAGWWAAPSGGPSVTAWSAS
ncbi:MAG: hypothetical protein LC640_09150 [Frankia sp.]|nr:hypothetical protein [Frankia sp.]